MQFMITAYDGKDDDALARRMNAREAHLDGAQALLASGNLIAGGAILDDEDRMIGSTLYVEFPTRQALDQWLQQDPYVTGKVWQDISIKPIRLAMRETD